MAAWIGARKAMIVLFCGLVALAPGVAAQLVNLEPTTTASGGGVAVSGTNDSTSSCVSLVLACAPGVAVSGTGDATGGTSASGDGTSNATFLAVSGLGSADSEGIAITTQGQSSGEFMALSIMGDADCGGASGCYTVSLTGDASGTGIGGCALLRATNLAAYCGPDGYGHVVWAVYDLLN